MLSGVSGPTLREEGRGGENVTGKRERLDKEELRTSWHGGEERMQRMQRGEGKAIPNEIAEFGRVQKEIVVRG